MWWRDFLKHNTYEISIPGLKDSALVPEGKTGVAISFLADHEMFRLAREGGWSNELKSYIEDELVGIISDSIFPALQDKVLKKFSFTPLNIASRVGSSEGAIVGWSFESEVPVENQIHKSANSVLTPLAHVYQAGQWAYSPAGVPMSILTGKLAADKVLKN